jgi:predicted nucleic acid-binding protein
MRVVADTNIFVSAALKQKSLPNLALYQVSRRCVLLKSVVTEAQFFEVIARSYIAALTTANTRVWLTQLMRSAEPQLLSLQSGDNRSLCWRTDWRHQVAAKLKRR